MPVFSADVVITYALNSLSGRSALVDDVGVLFGQWGPLLCVALYVWIWFRPRQAPRAAPDAPARTGARSPRFVHEATVRAALAGGLSLLVSAAVSAAVYRPRPFVYDPSRFHAVVPHALDSSFPSDHTAIAFAFAAVAAAAGLPARGPLVVIAVLIALGRLYLGAHWPTDVAAGAVIGWLVGMAVERGRDALRPVMDPLVQLGERVLGGSRPRQSPRR